MTPDGLDLRGGKAPPENAGDSGNSKPPKPKGDGGGRSERSQRRDRAGIRERLFAIFERLAERLEGRGDVELAAIVRQDMKAMVGGLESLTRRVPGAAAPILWTLGILEPLLAFGRIARLLLDRWAERRAAAHLEGDYPPGDYPPGDPEPEDQPGSWPPE